MDIQWLEECFQEAVASALIYFLYLRLLLEDWAGKVGRHYMSKHIDMCISLGNDNTWINIFFY